MTTKSGAQLDQEINEALRRRHKHAKKVTAAPPPKIPFILMSLEDLADAEENGWRIKVGDIHHFGNFQFQIIAIDENGVLAEAL